MDELERPSRRQINLELTASSRHGHIGDSPSAGKADFGQIVVGKLLH